MSLSKTQKTSIKSTEKKWRELKVITVLARWRERTLVEAADPVLALLKEASHPLREVRQRERWDVDRSGTAERLLGPRLCTCDGDRTASVSLPRVLTPGNTLEVEASIASRRRQRGHHV